MTDAPPKIGAVILAAGAGTRMGGVAKALLPAPSSGPAMSPIHGAPWPGGRRFIDAILEAAAATVLDASESRGGWGRLRLVVGPPHGAAIREYLSKQFGDVDRWVIENPQPERGMASSVAMGFAKLPLDVGAAWLWPVDHPFVRFETLRVLIDALATHAAVRPTFEGRRGHPPLISRALFADLAACTDVEGGARTVLAAADTIDVAVDDPGVVRDIDTPADLEAP